MTCSQSKLIFKGMGKGKIKKLYVSSNIVKIKCPQRNISYTCCHIEYLSVPPFYAEAGQIENRTNNREGLSVMHLVNSQVINFKMFLGG